MQYRDLVFARVGSVIGAINLMRGLEGLFSNVDVDEVIAGCEDEKVGSDICAYIISEAYILSELNDRKASQYLNEEAVMEIITGNDELENEIDIVARRFIWLVTNSSSLKNIDDDAYLRFVKKISDAYQGKK